VNSSASRPALGSRNQSRDRVIGWAFVGAQVALIVSLAFLPGADHYPVPAWLATAADVVFWAGVALAVAAGLVLGRALTATPVPTERATLRTSGPYRWVRHPIYTGVLLIILAMAVRSGSLFGLSLGAATVVFFHVKASWEERRLTERFDGYAAYATVTPRFIPSPRHLRRGER
jgi:protein-S-isoprenylcysteine O-methyltransferase Ste14